MEDFQKEQIDEATPVETILTDVELHDDASLLLKLETEPNQEENKVELTEDAKKKKYHEARLRAIVQIIHRIYGRANLWAVKHYAEDNNMSLLDIREEIERKSCRLSANARKIVVDIKLEELAELLEVRSGIQKEAPAESYIETGIGTSDPISPSLDELETED